MSEFEHIPPDGSGRRNRSGHGIFAGALAGAVVCGVVRGGFTAYNIHTGSDFDFLSALPSTAIGFLCGAVAGGFCRPMLGAVLGAVLSAGVFGAFVIPIAFLLEILFDAGEKAGAFTWFYFVQKAIAGIIGGAVGGMVGENVARTGRS